MQQLPVELLLEIFQWATDSRYSSPVSSLHYTPFQALEAEGEIASLKIKRNLSLVCRQWRQLTVQLLFQDLWITRGAVGLRGALQTVTPEGNSYGDWVRPVLST